MTFLQLVLSDVKNEILFLKEISSPYKYLLQSCKSIFFTNLFLLLMKKNNKTNALKTNIDPVGKKIYTPVTCKPFTIKSNQRHH